jgi:hypothetical protein
VECTCAQMRRLVAERDGELWKPMYEAVAAKQRMRWRWLDLFPPFLSSESSEDEEVLSWKGKCVGARTRRHYGFSWILRSLRSLSDSYSTLSVSDYLGVSDGWSDPPAEEEERVSRLSTLRKAEGTKKTAQDEATRLRRDPHPVVSVPVETPVTPPIHDVFVNRRGKNFCNRSGSSAVMHLVQRAAPSPPINIGARGSIYNTMCHTLTIQVGDQRRVREVGIPHSNRA